MRKRMSAGLDKKIFKHTATRTRKINVNPVSMRGGIRL